MFNEVFVESEISSHPKTLEILQRLNFPNYFEIDHYDQYWGRAKKPYLQKRESLNLYIAKKKGQLVKLAPDAYGGQAGEHYYFIHAYNCIYECEYCYLQGHFKTPDMVMFINHEEIIAEMGAIIEANPEKTYWFHAGEFSDSLALSHITGELEQYFGFFSQHPNAYLELRTKSANIKELLKLKPLKNVITTFSLSTKEMIKNVDRKTPTLNARLNAMEKLSQAGHTLGIHFDPIYFIDEFESNYQQLIADIKNKIDFKNVHYISIGVVRFTKDVHREVEQNYPESTILKTPMSKSFDGKIRYSRPVRMWMMNKVKQILMDAGAPSEIIYLCMENE